MTSPAFRWRKIIIFPEFFLPREMATYAYLVGVIILPPSMPRSQRKYLVEWVLAHAVPKSYYFF